MLAMEYPLGTVCDESSYYPNFLHLARVIALLQHKSNHQNMMLFTLGKWPCKRFRERFHAGLPIGYEGGWEWHRLALINLKHWSRLAAISIMRPFFGRGCLKLSRAVAFCSACCYSKADDDTGGVILLLCIPSPKGFFYAQQIRGYLGLFSA